MHAAMARVCTGMIVASVGLMAGCVSTPEMPPLREGALPESAFLDRPWAKHPPVDIVRRLRAVQQAVGGLQQSVNAYSASLQAQAAQQNRAVLLQAELARQEALKPRAEPRRGNFATRGTPAEIDAAARAARVINPAAAPNPTWRSPSVQETMMRQEFGEAMYGHVRSLSGWNEWAMSGLPK